MYLFQKPLLNLCLCTGLTLGALVPGTALHAQDASSTGSATGEGISLIEQGAKMLLEELMGQLGPTLNEMGQTLNEVGPALEEMGPELRGKVAQLLATMGDLRNYGTPQVQPNGDILIPRTAPLTENTPGFANPFANPTAPGQNAPSGQPPTGGPSGEIEL